MNKMDPSYLQGMKGKLDVELLGVFSIEASTPEGLRSKALSLLPSAKSVIVLGKEMHKEIVSLLSPTKETGAAEPGELLIPHMDYLSGRLNKATYDLIHLFKKEGYRSLPLPSAGCPMDQRTLTAIFSYKYAGVLAGLGTIGKNGLLITPEYGPRVRLACLLTEAPLEGSPRKVRDDCLDCNACIQACPAHALNDRGENGIYSMNPFACRTYRQAGISCSMCMKACDEALSG